MRRPRCKAVLKWTGAGLCTLICVAWFVSGWWTTSIEQGDGRDARSVSLVFGRMLIYTGPAAGRVPRFRFRAPELAAGQHAPIWIWSPGIEGEGQALLLGVPLWIPFLLLVAPTAWLFYTDRRTIRRARAGLCTGCGYDRAGLELKTPCPECGR